jgi:bifunctional DNase/RNase
MSRPWVKVQVRALAAAGGGVAVFLGNEQKVFVMRVDSGVGAAIALFLQGTPKARPLTHDLIADVLGALGAKVEKVIINDFERDTYFARLVLSVENELTAKQLIELDARPSDGVALATQQGAPIYVSLEVWDRVEDVTEALRELQAESPPHPEGDEPEGP